MDIESSIEIVTGAPVLKSCHLSGITVRGSAKPQIELCSFKAAAMGLGMCFKFWIDTYIYIYLCIYIYIHSNTA